MKVLSTAPAHLSNYEVLMHFISQKRETDIVRRQLDDHALRNKVAMRKEYPLKIEKEEAPDGTALPEMDEKVRKREDEADRRGHSQELGWIQNEVIKYLCSDLVPTARQTSEGVSELANQLQDHGLTKGEVLQIVNLAPSLPVELYVIIEDVDTRFQPDASARLEQIAEHVQGTLLPDIPKQLQQLVDDMEPGGGGRRGRLGLASGQVTPAAADKVGKWNADQGDMDDEEAAMMQDEYVHEAEYGAEHEEGVEHGDKTGEIDT